MLNGTNAIGCQTKGYGLAENFGWERANLQIRLPATASLVVGMTYIIAKMGLFATYGTYTSHRTYADLTPPFNTGCYNSEINTY